MMDAVISKLTTGHTREQYSYCEVNSRKYCTAAQNNIYYRYLQSRSLTR